MPDFDLYKRGRFGNSKLRRSIILISTHSYPAAFFSTKLPHNLPMKDRSSAGPAIVIGQLGLDRKRNMNPSRYLLNIQRMRGAENLV